MVKPSWIEIDIKALRRFSLNKIELRKKGELTLEDQIGLVKFVKSYPKRIEEFRKKNNHGKRDS